MTLYELIGAIEVAASRQPTINTIVRNDVLRLNTLPSVKYGVFVWTQLTHEVGLDLQTFVFAFFYVDRLTENKGNEVEVQSVGIETIGNVLRVLDEWGIPYAGWTAQTFNQRFMDECAGVYGTIRLQVPANYACPDDAVEYPEWPDPRRDDFTGVESVRVINGTLIIV